MVFVSKAKSRHNKKRKQTRHHKKSHPGKKIATAVRAEVKRDINHMAETKYVSQISSAAYNNSIGAGDCYPLLPAVTQGNTDYQRTGNKITPVYLRVKIALQPRDASLFLNQALPPITARVLILSQKTIRFSPMLNGYGTTPAQFAYTSMLDDRIGTTLPRQYLGDYSTLDNLAPINKEVFTVHMDKKVKFHGENTSGNTGASMQMLDKVRYVYATIKLPKLLYDDLQSTSYPTNAAPFISFGFVNEGGTAPTALFTPLQVNWIATLYYKDF
jgi:hypothetical protein